MQDNVKDPKENSPRGAFDGNEGEEITVEEAGSQTRGYRTKHNDKISTGEFPLANFYGKNIIHKILKQPGCMGIRIYLALNQKEQLEVLLVGVDAEQNDILVAKDEGGDKKGCNIFSSVMSIVPASPVLKPGVIAGSPTPCPTMCGHSNPVNS